ncbi:60S ribosomal protein L26 FAMILY MEMBER [Anaeramoeba flamelloides]|uniref:60S ribosomal protein L26 FAMILY MEMBER n=1 Tax=Anaeramoeba flamelloides TaxID=1746091 RepID=A0AAV7ZL01_9EUKA|nr:60S ribosomal protein L26 FAMILY MEMBER [Anaeramoeba flamelloides]KAJ6234719.1 60S ribosomal protein L26 FAMILY MEMBER [Anaeramoeba flamelloides]KAJ6242372.1 60S ribosomal protein L26 FAMILY MEMBER [Anaeramoeba flamelloides]
MKIKRSVSSSRRKNRKKHFTASSSERRIRMTCPLSTELREKYNVRRLPVIAEDEVKVLRGKFKKSEGKVLSVYRKKYSITIENVQKTKKNGEQVQIPVHPNKCLITKLKLTKSRERILARKNRLRGKKVKSTKEQKIDSKMTEVD